MKSTIIVDIGRWLTDIKLSVHVSNQKLEPGKAQKMRLKMS